jgi:hypothetical protein
MTLSHDELLPDDAGFFMALLPLSACQPWWAGMPSVPPSPRSANEANQRPRKSALDGLLALVRAVFTPFPRRMRPPSMPRPFTGVMGIRTSGLDDQTPPAHPMLVPWIPQELARRKP